MKIIHNLIIKDNVYFEGEEPVVMKHNTLLNNKININLREKRSNSPNFHCYNVVKFFKKNLKKNNNLLTDAKSLDLNKFRKNEKNTFIKKKIKTLLKKKKIAYLNWLNSSKFKNNSIEIDLFKKNKKKSNKKPKNKIVFSNKSYEYPKLNINYNKVYKIRENDLKSFKNEYEVNFNESIYGFEAKSIKDSCKKIKIYKNDYFKDIKEKFIYAENLFCSIIKHNNFKKFFAFYKYFNYSIFFKKNSFLNKTNNQIISLTDNKIRQLLLKDNDNTDKVKPNRKSLFGQQINDNLNNYFINFNKKKPKNKPKPKNNKFNLSKFLRHKSIKKKMKIKINQKIVYNVKNLTRMDIYSICPSKFILNFNNTKKMYYKSNWMDKINELLNKKNLFHSFNFDINYYKNFDFFIKPNIRDELICNSNFIRKKEILY